MTQSFLVLQPHSKASSKKKLGAALSHRQGRRQPRHSQRASGVFLPNQTTRACLQHHRARRTYHMVQLLHNALDDFRFTLQQFWSKFLIQPGLQESEEDVSYTPPPARGENTAMPRSSCSSGPSKPHSPGPGRRSGPRYLLQAVDQLCRGEHQLLAVAVRVPAARGRHRSRQTRPPTAQAQPPGNVDEESRCGVWPIAKRGTASSANQEAGCNEAFSANHGTIPGRSFFSQSERGLSWPIRRLVGNTIFFFGSQGLAQPAAVSTNQGAASSCNYWAYQEAERSCSCFSQSGLSGFDTRTRPRTHSHTWTHPLDTPPTHP